MNNSLINPFLLFGLDVHKHINLKEVRKTYHQLCLLTHPDKGGNKTDFLIIHQAYKYISKQVEQSKDMIPLEILEEDFQNFCEENKVEKLPSLLDIRDDVALFNQKFNENWDINNTISNHFDKGYGSLMDRSELNDERKENQTDDCIINLTNEFTSEVIKYTEPNALPENYGSYQRYDITEVDNYGNLPEQLYDYKETYSKINKKIEDKIQDNPITDFENLLKRRQQERDNFKQSLCDMPIISLLSNNEQEEIEEI